jgi:hypothetical protein
MNERTFSSFALIRPARAAGLIALALLTTSVALADAFLTEVSGTVEIGRGEPARWSPAKEGELVAAMERVRTGSDGRVEIKLEAGMLRMHENSMLRLPPAIADVDRVELERGHSLFDILHRGGRQFEVHTPTVVVSVRGTRFGVDAGHDIGEVTVYRGLVGVREFGAEGAMETLVREGFLATGGVGVAIELDVSRGGDPWTRWGNSNNRELRDRREVPARMNDTDRAKSLLHRATTADVISKAAERKPEIAERLRQLQVEQRLSQKAATDAKNEAGRAGEEGDPAIGSSRPVPASPAFASGTDKPRPDAQFQKRLENDPNANRSEGMHRRIQDGERAIRRAEIREKLRMEAMMEIDEGTWAGQTFSNGQTSLDFESLSTLEPSELMLVMEALGGVKTDLDTGVLTFSSPDEFLLEIEQSLVRLGMDSAEANGVIQLLTGQ